MSAAVVAIVYGVPYALRARTLARHGRPVPLWRRLCFAAGVLVLVAAVAPPIGIVADRRLWVHMAEHLMIGDIASLLVVLGLTGPMIAPVLRARWLRALAHPVVALVLWAANFYLWHLRVAYQGAVDHDAIHAVQHACFFAFGANLWFALLGPLPKPAWFGNLARLGYVIAARVAGTVLANLFLWAEVVFYPHYHHGLGDQRAAGGVMLVEQSLLTVGLFAWLFVRAARDLEERQALLELASAHGVELAPQRAARAVAAGRGAELRARVVAGGRASPPDS
jgi:putative membrane protein